MPRSTHSRRAKNKTASTAQTTSTVQEDTMSTATDTKVDETDAMPEFSFDVESAPADFEPIRRSPGRSRRPSPFDTVLNDPQVYEKGWKQVKYTSEEHKAAIVSELNRAKQFLGVGLDIDQTGEDAVAFRSRPLQKRERKAKTGAEALPEQDGDNGDSDE